MLSAQAVLLPACYVMDKNQTFSTISNESNDSPFLPDDPSESDEDSSGSVCLELEEEILQPHSSLIEHMVQDSNSSPVTVCSPFLLQGALRNLLKPPRFA
jgi:hypothetical protein